MRVGVTGATGFLGKSICHALLAHGYTVIGMGRNLVAGKALAKLGVQFSPGLLENRSDVEKFVQQSDSIIHCGALSSVWGSYADFYQANVQGTRHVAESCIRFGLQKLVHISSASVYCTLRPQFEIKEEQKLPKKAINFYAQTKRLAENEIQKIAGKGISCVILRPQAIFGPGDPAILPRIILANAKMGLPIFTTKPVILDLTFVDNVADSARLALEKENLPNDAIYNITNGEPVSLFPLLQILFSMLDIPIRTRKISFPLALALAYGLEQFHHIFLPHREPLLTRYSIAVLAMSRTLDISKARTELEYAPLISISEGLQRFADWYQKGSDA